MSATTVTVLISPSGRTLDGGTANHFAELFKQVQAKRKAKEHKS